MQQITNMYEQKQRDGITIYQEAFILNVGAIWKNNDL